MLQLAANTGRTRPCQQRLLLHTKQSRYAKRLERAVLHLAQTHVITPLWITSHTATVIFASRSHQEWNPPFTLRHAPKSTTLATRLAALERVAAAWTADYAALMANAFILPNLLHLAATACATPGGTACIVEPRIRALTHAAVTVSASHRM